MTLLAALYTLIISPLELLFEVVFTIANRIIGNAGLSIIFLSLAVNFLVLPLYKRADELQAEERDIQIRMAPMIKHIKSTFEGDERFMMLQEYYKINHYKPVYALKSTASLLLQIPFFIAAYNLLSGMQSLQGMQFGPIADLGKEDAMFMIGSFPVNVLPILMTLINIVSGIIYTKGHPVKEKIQVYGLAAVFLVLLYRSPSGLVFYWLLNNVFSLVKNVFYKLKDPKKALNTLLAIAGAVILVLTLIRPDLDARQKFLLAIGSILLAAPLLSELIKKKTVTGSRPAKKLKGDNLLFFAGVSFMALLTGCLIPSTVIDASTYEFIDILKPSSPVLYVVNSMLISLGSWVLWGGVFYFFMTDRIKALFCKGIWAVCGAAVFNYMLFGTKLGILSSTLQYETEPFFALSEYALNALLILAVTFVFCYVCKNYKKVTGSVLIIGIMTVLSIGIYNCVHIADQYRLYVNSNKVSEDIPSIPLSTEGNNVIVLMLDRAMGNQIPYIMNEKPELKEQFDGFTFYPNTVSFGPCTNIASPALYGGYEYTPERINLRDEETLESKQNEALRVMPVIFGNSGYEVTVCDPSYAGYKWIPDLTIYDDHPEFHCYNTRGIFNYFEEYTEGGTKGDMTERVSKLCNRNFFCYSMMKISPVLLQETLYDGGLYNESYPDDSDSSWSFPAVVQHVNGISQSTGYGKLFLDSYTVLAKLPEITAVNDSDQNTFLMMSNDTPHYPCLLQEPDYVPALNVDNTAYDVNMKERYTVNGVTMKMTTEEHVTHYDSNMAALLQLGKWFDYMREQGVYDNTRIIIVSDHGRGIDQFDIKCNGEDMEYFMPLLMVKDFDATGFTVSDDFMTNGDTPALAMADIIDDPVNPFTQKPINSQLKEGRQLIFCSYDWIADEGSGNTFSPGPWYTVEGDPHDPSNWEYAGEH